MSTFSQFKPSEIGRSTSVYNRSSCYSTLNNNNINNINNSLGWDTTINSELQQQPHIQRNNSIGPFVHSGLDTYQKYINTQRRNLKITPNYKQSDLHEIHRIEKPFYITSVEEIERYWKAKYIMLDRQKQQLEFDLKFQQQQATKKPVILKKEPLSQIAQVEQEIEALQNQLKNKTQQLNNLKLESEDLDVQFDNIHNTNSTFYREEKQLKHIQQSFKDLNRRYHETEEQITMKENEVDARRKQLKRKSSIIIPQNLRNSQSDMKFNQRSSFKRQSINSGTMSPTRVTFSLRSQQSSEYIK